MIKYLIAITLNVVTSQLEARGLDQLAQPPLQANQVDTYGTHTPNYSSCGASLLSRLGKPPELLDLYKRYSARKDDDFLLTLLSVIYVESKFDKGARSHMDAIGLMQMTRIAVDDATQRCDLRRVLHMDHLLDSAMNIRYGSCYLAELLEEMNQDIKRSLIIYNGGYRQLQKYNSGEPMASETANYVLHVTRIKEEMCSSQSN